MMVVPAVLIHSIGLSLTLWQPSPPSSSEKPQQGVEQRKSNSPSGAASAPKVKAISNEESTSRTEDPFATPMNIEDLNRSWGYSSEEASGPNYVSQKVSLITAPANPIGFYQGVQVVGHHLPPVAPPSLGITPAVLTWTGIEQINRHPSVFLQLSAKVDYELDESPKRATLRLHNTSVTSKNNLRPLDTRYFNLPVDRVTVRRSGTDTLVHLDLRHSTKPKISVRDGAQGYKIFVIQFVEDKGPS